MRASIDRKAPTTKASDLKFRRIYFCSKALRKITAGAGFDVMHGAVIYCPTDMRKFSGAAKTKEQPCKKLLWVGRIAEDKGIFTALRAMKSVPADLSVHLNIYGGGDAPYVKQMKDFVTENDLPVSFHRAAMDEMLDTTFDLRRTAQFIRAVVLCFAFLSDQLRTALRANRYVLNGTQGGIPSFKVYGRDLGNDLASLFHEDEIADANIQFKQGRSSADTHFLGEGGIQQDKCSQG
jgi:glycosyltransferase involved in cell wall biosynthesis